MPSIQDYIDVFEPILKRGEDIICICITTKFSGSYNSASNAKDMLLEDYPDRKIVVIDSKINTVLQGLLVEETSEMKKDNYDFDEVVNTIETIKPTGRIIFTIGSMSYLVAGGRVGKLSGIGAGVLGIKPNIVLKEGEIFNEGISRGRKKSLQKVIDTTIKHFKDNNINPNDYKFCIGFGYDKEEGQRFLDAMTDALKTNFKDFSQNIYLRQIGATISVHTGPHPLGIAFIKKYK
jgi:DegV family protein with EDD domain